MIIVLPNARTIDTLRFLHGRDMSITTVRAISGNQLNIATQPIDMSNVLPIKPIDIKTMKPGLFRRLFIKTDHTDST